MKAPIKWGAVTVPYTAMWTAEAEGRKPRLVVDTLNGRKITMLSEGITDQSGKPLFKMLHADRCREVVKRGVCQMCLRNLPGMVVTVNQGQQDAYRPLISDGLPMCPQCAAEAFRACPGMQRQHERGTLRMWLSRRGDWLLAPVVLGAAAESQGGDERVNRLLRGAGRPVFTGPKLVLTSWTRLDALADLAPSHA